MCTLTIPYLVTGACCCSGLCALFLAGVVRERSLEWCLTNFGHFCSTVHLDGRLLRQHSILPLLQNHLRSVRTLWLRRLLRPGLSDEGLSVVADCFPNLAALTCVSFSSLPDGHVGRVLERTCCRCGQSSAKRRRTEAPQQCVKRLGCVETLKLCGVPVGSDDMAAIARVVRRCLSLRRLDLVFNYGLPGSVREDGTPADLSAVLDAVAHSESLRELRVKDNPLAGDGLKVLFARPPPPQRTEGAGPGDGLFDAAELEELDGLAAAAAAEAAVPTVFHLELAQCTFSAADLAPLRTAPLRWLRLNCLNLAGTPLGSDVAEMVRALRVAGSVLQELRVGMCGLGMRGLVEVAAVLPRLERLFAPMNAAAPGDGAVLADLLLACPRLRQLLLLHCGLREQHAEAAAAALCGGAAPALESVTLSGNTLQSGGAALGAALLLRGRLHSLHLCSCGLDLAALATIAGALPDTTGLRPVVLGVGPAPAGVPARTWADAAARCGGGRLVQVDTDGAAAGPCMDHEA
eukprot:TRINITY_DN12831_c0_g1_i1.p1 TRINITY_DN12831_c0_g1~~TRINITY_DN12831_c0_g1_i1.p1  ORF type:complete len:519 (+),score=130.02 TRINITY_DN12831_c0_g1_i1:417-1973(+)